MKLLAFRTFGDDEMEIVLHPRVTVLTGLASDRRARLAAALDAMLHGDVAVGEAVLEIDGVRLPLTEEVWRDLAVRPTSSPVLRPRDLPGARVVGGARPADAVAPVPRAAVSSKPDPAPPGTVAEPDTAAAAVASAERRLAAADAAFDDQRSTIAELERTRADLDVARDAATTALARADAKLPALTDAAQPPVPEPIAEPARVDVAALMEVPASLLADARANLDAAQRELADLERQPGASDPALVAELEAAHAEVVDAEERSGRGAKRRLADAVAREEAVLQKMGMPSYGAFLVRTSVLEASSHEYRVAQARLALADAQAVWDELHAVPAAPAPVEAAAATVDKTIEAKLAAAGRTVEKRRRELATLEDELGDVSGRIAELSYDLGAIEDEQKHAAEALAAVRERTGAVAAKFEPDTVLDLTPRTPLIVPQPAAVDAGGVDGEKLEIYLLSRLLAHRSAGGRAGSVPIVIDDAFGDLSVDMREEALALLSRMADGVQVVYLTDRPEMELWAFAQGPKDALSVAAPERARRRSQAGSRRANAG